MDSINRIRKIDEFFDNLSIEEFEEILIKAGIEDINSDESADYIEVVRCIDCIHTRKHVKIIQEDGRITHPHRFCELMYPDIGFKDDDYCSYGERKLI